MTPEDAANFRRTLELGKEIADSLSESDVLGRWMAHHISDLIIKAENAPGPEGDDIRREAATAILALWNQRTEFPSTAPPPLGAFEPVFRALERLSEPQDPWSFYRRFPPGREPSEDDMSAAPLLRIALSLEETVRRVTGEIVALAAQEAVDKEAKWLKLSEHLEEDEQRAARDALLQLARTLETYTDKDPAVDAGLPKLLAALQGAESQLAEARQALKDRSPVMPSENDPDEPV
ncbi:hypothetical protein [Streptomyces chartreusis]|uniref:Uncharacterized protein n=1 Tax=Streptomyces chartreusis TaxID=1969 RepID=A0A7H8T585_STRCX|nr:hypothetical protein [Streptomyces chartreusis]QKZ17050.1 hypothetical protein HUT05_06510 [Streptomyces chartreusis]